MIRCKFDRIGRRHDVDDLEVEAPVSANDLAERVYHHARKYLGSKVFEVDLSLEEGRGLIEWGRFGSFTIEEVPA